LSFLFRGLKKEEQPFDIDPLGDRVSGDGLGSTSSGIKCTVAVPGSKRVHAENAEDRREGRIWVLIQTVERATLDAEASSS
jgi:hypothetical protein